MVHGPKVHLLMNFGIGRHYIRATLWGYTQLAFHCAKVGRCGPIYCSAAG